MITARKIFRAVAEAFEVPDHFYILADRTNRLARARFAAWKMLRDEKLGTLEEIGRMSGGKDHGSIHHGVQRANKLLETDEDFQGAYRHAARLLTKEIYITTVYT